MAFQFSSAAFQNGRPIPRQYTCDGDDLSPPLSWTDPPEGTVTLALINDDPDAPAKTWVHWVIYNIPPTARELKENVPPAPELPDGSMQGMNDFGRVGYGGPCPPTGTHRYYFKLYALDCVIPLPPRISKSQLESAMKNHVLGQTEWIGTYRRQ